MSCTQSSPILSKDQHQTRVFFGANTLPPNQAILVTRRVISVPAVSQPLSFYPPHSLHNRITNHPRHPSKTTQRLKRDYQRVKHTHCQAISSIMGRKKIEIRPLVVSSCHHWLGFWLGWPGPRGETFLQVTLPAWTRYLIVGEAGGSVAQA